MTNLDAVWGTTSADSEQGEEKAPPAGYMGCPRVTDTRAGQSKKGESYFIVELTDEQQGYRWVIYKALTKNGQPHEGSIKSAKITLRQLGLDVPAPSMLDSALKTLIGKYFTVEQRGSGRINQNTGQEYVNTEVTGPASAPTMQQPAAASAPQVQAPAPAGGMQFQAAVPGQAPTVVPQQQPAPGSQFGDQAPWS